MQIFLPKPRLPVLIGPPAPPAPTLVQFERNVVVLRGSIDDRPDQLTCDTLKLSLIPAEKTTPVDTAQSHGGLERWCVAKAEAGSNPKQAVEPRFQGSGYGRTGEPAVAGGDKQADADDSKPKSAPKPEVDFEQRSSRRTYPAAGQCDRTRRLAVVAGTGGQAPLQRADPLKAS